MSVPKPIKPQTVHTLRHKARKVQADQLLAKTVRIRNETWRILRILQANQQARGYAMSTSAIVNTLLEIGLDVLEGRHPSEQPAWLVALREDAAAHYTATQEADQTVEHRVHQADGSVVSIVTDDGRKTAYSQARWAKGLPPHLTRPAEEETEHA